MQYAKEYGYEVQIMEPDTPWRSNPTELAKRNTHGLTEQAIAQMLGKYVPYTVNDALRAVSPNQFNLDARDKKKVEHSLFDYMKEEETAGGDSGKLAEDKTQKIASQSNTKSSLRYPSASPPLLLSSPCPSSLFSSPSVTCRVYSLNRK